MCQVLDSGAFDTVLVGYSILNPTAGRAAPVGFAGRDFGNVIDRLQDRLYELMPYVPTVSRTYFHFTSCRIKNSPLTKPNHNHVSLKQAWLDPSGC